MLFSLFMMMIVTRCAANCTTHKDALDDLCQAVYEFANLLYIIRGDKRWCTAHKYTYALETYVLLYKNEAVFVQNEYETMRVWLCAYTTLAIDEKYPPSSEHTLFIFSLHFIKRFQPE